MENELRWVAPVNTSFLAIAAGYMGLFSVLLFPAPIALVLGISALVSLKHHPGRRGKGRAIFGLIMGLLGTALLVLFLVVLATDSQRRR